MKQAILGIIIWTSVYFNVSFQANARQAVDNVPKLSLQFIDEVTGFRVRPDSVSIRNLFKKNTITLTSADITQLINEIDIAKGDYKVTVYSTGYKPMCTDFTLSGGLFVCFTWYP